jgi:tRNA (guanine-N7-)-methyltransferase
MIQQEDLRCASDWSLEIGFGSGEHLIQQARFRPEHLFVGVDLFLTGICHLLRAIEVHAIQNIRIAITDGRALLDFVSQHNPGTLRDVYLLFPDPWPKTRHVKRRLLQHGWLPVLHQALQPQGAFRIATDHPIYQCWVTEIMSQSSFFRAQNPYPHLRPTIEDWPMTRYEQKAISAGRNCHYWDYRRIETKSDLA